MAGSQGSALAIATCNAGGLGSLPAALFTIETLRAEIAAVRAQTRQSLNLNFFSHSQPPPDAAREAAWRAALAPYYAEYRVDAAGIPAGPDRMPFNTEALSVVEEIRPAVVSFHFGLPTPDLLARVRGTGAKILSTATTLDEARWLEANGADAII